MKIIDETCLKQFRTAGKCENCGRRCSGRHPHHLLTRGFGGATRLDVPRNLIALCPACHRDHHDGRRPGTTDLIGIVARREGMRAVDLEDELYRLRREPTP